MERDVDRGIIPACALDPVDTCYRSLGAVLDSARVEIEAAGLDADRACQQHLVSGWGMLARRLFRAMYQPEEVRSLAGLASSIGAEGRGLLEHLWTRFHYSLAKSGRLGPE